MQWHAKNGLGILIGEIVAWIVFIVLGIVHAGRRSAAASAMISCVVWIGFLVVRILCIVKGVGGQRFTRPGLTDFGQKINF